MRSWHGINSEGTGDGGGNNTIDFELTQNERVNRIRADTSLIIEKVSSSYKFNKKPGF